jgi:hypothetical protein
MSSAARTRFARCLVTIIATVGGVVGSARADSDHNPRPEDAPHVAAPAYQGISPKDGILRFSQVHFQFDFGQLADSDWGQVEVYASKLEKYSNGCGGFINVFAYSPFLEEPQRVVADMYIPPTHDDGVCVLNDVKDVEERDASRGRSTAENEIPYARFLDLRPGGEAVGPLPEMDVLGIFSHQPLAHRLETITLAHPGIGPNRFPVDPAPYDAQGGFTFLPGDDPLPLPDPNPGNLIDPGPPPPVVNLPMDVDDFTFPEEVMQGGWPNIESAKNQCFPIAIANVMGFLERSFDSEQIMEWDLPHSLSTRGLGLVRTTGDVLSWIASPGFSLVANVDKFAQRLGVTGENVGEGTTGCGYFNAVFGYGAAFGDEAGIEYRHQAGQSTIDPNALPGCEAPPFDVGDKVSTREGIEVTFDWIFEQLSKGRGVLIGITYFDSGEPSGGHGMRVRGATRVNGHTYLTFVNDKQQGSGFGGLEYPVFEVSDTRGPLLTAVPNGKLELDHGTTEINFAMSFEPRPTLRIL